MPYFKDDAGNLHYLSDWDIENGGLLLLPSDAVPITDEEAHAIQNPPPTDAQIAAANTAKLQQLNQLAAAQKTALTNRIGTLNDAIDLDMAEPEEIAELPVRTAQLKAWKAYAVLLGRVTAQSGWALTVTWPVQPAEGMDLTISATAPDLA